MRRCIAPLLLCLGLGGAMSAHAEVCLRFNYVSSNPPINELWFMWVRPSDAASIEATFNSPSLVRVDKSFCPAPPDDPAPIRADIYRYLAMVLAAVIVAALLRQVLDFIRRDGNAT